MRRHKCFTKTQTGMYNLGSEIRQVQGMIKEGAGLHNHQGKLKRDNYMKRWGIETTFRVQDEVKIKTKSLISMIRIALFVFECMLYNVW